MLGCKQWAAMQAVKSAEPAVVAKAVKMPVKQNPVPEKVEVPVGFVCPVCEARKVADRAKMKAYRLRKKSV